MRHYFTNSGINKIYAHGAIFTGAESIGWVFGPLYLLELGYSISATFLVWAGLFAVRLPMRYLYWWQIERIGLRGGVIGGLAFYAAGIAILPSLPERPDLLPLFVGLYAAGMTLYWTAFHTLFGMIGDDDKRGNQLAMLKSLNMVISALVPGFSALIVTGLGFIWLFAISAFGMLLAAAPLLTLPMPQLKRGYAKTAEHQTACSWIFQFHWWLGIKEYGHPFLWRVMVYLMIGSIAGFGGVMTAGLLILVVLELLVGRAVDKGNGFRLFQCGALIAQLQILFRAFLATTPAAIIASEAMSVSSQLMGQATANFYNQGADSENYFHYIYIGEVGWDLGAAISLSAMAGLIYLGAPLPWLLVATGSIGLWGLYRINMRVRPDGAAAR